MTFNALAHLASSGSKIFADSICISFGRKTPSLMCSDTIGIGTASKIGTTLNVVSKSFYICTPLKPTETPP